MLMQDNRTPRAAALLPFRAASCRHFRSRFRRPAAAVLAAVALALLVTGCGTQSPAQTGDAGTPPRAESGVLSPGNGAGTASAESAASDTSEASPDGATGAGTEESAAPSTSAGTDAEMVSFPAADVTVDEAFYANWVNELTWNCELYLEQTVRIQGMYFSEPLTLSSPEPVTAYYVYRVGPGCCGSDGDLCGLQLSLPEGFSAEAGDWLDVYGTLRICELDGWRFLMLDDVTAVVDNAHRGLENVLHQL